jgi:ACS family sodium-dependent inorganic phosphate cotransporter
MREHFGWSQTQKGLVLASFFIGYLLFMFPAGLIANRFGGKRVLSVAVLTWSIFTLLTPLAASFSIAALVTARIGMGIGEAAMFPATYEIFGRWVPPMERARAIARFTSGIPVGTLVGLMGSGLLVQRFGWSMPFYGFGALGFFWLFIWVQQVANDPAADTRLRAEERALLQATQPATQTMQRTTLRRLLLHRSVAGIIAGHVAFTWTLYILLSWLPSYFREVHGLSIAQSGLFSAAPWLTMLVVGNVAGWVADRMIQRGMNLTVIRKIMQCGALLGSAGLLLALQWAHSPAAALAILCGATGALACTSAGHLSIYLDVAPRDGAVLFGFGNTFGTIPGIISVAVTGWLVDVTGTYSAAFLLTAIVSATGALLFGFFADACPIVD